MLHPIATSAAALGAVNIQHVELADQISKDDCAIAGHGDDHRIVRNPENRAAVGDQIAILLGRKATFLLALMWIDSPVAGLRPTRAARLRTTKIPSPAIFTRSPFFKCSVIMPIRSSSICRPCFFVR